MGDPVAAALAGSGISAAAVAVNDLISALLAAADHSAAAVAVDDPVAAALAGAGISAAAIAVGYICPRFQGLRILWKTVLRRCRQIYCCSTYQQTYQYFFHDRS